MTAAKKPASGKPKAAPPKPKDEVKAIGKDANIYQRMAAVMAEVGSIPKNAHNDFHHYDYATEEDILNTLRPLMVKHGLATTVTVGHVDYLRFEGADKTKDQEIRRVEMVFTIVNVDKPEEVIYSTFTGEGWDKGDKGIYKAYTSTMKYWLLKTFLAPTGDDAERENIVAAKQQAATREGGGAGAGVPGSKPRSGGLVSKPQLNLMFKLGDDLDFEPKDWTAMKIRYKVDHSNELTVDQASDLITRMKELVKDMEAAKEEAVAEAEKVEAAAVAGGEVSEAPAKELPAGPITDEEAAEMDAARPEDITDKINSLFPE